MAMELVRGIHNLRPRHRGCAATIGNFDGVHLGHRHMIATLRERATALGVPAVVVTFEPTPREHFEGAAAPSRLSRLREKLAALEACGVERVVGLSTDGPPSTLTLTRPIGPRRTVAPARCISRAFSTIAS